MKKPLAILLIFFHILPSIPFAQQTETVAVIEFEGNGVSDFEVTALTDRFRDELVKLGNETVVERGRMEEVLTEQAFQQTGCTSSECAVEVGKLLSVQKIIVGSISKVGNVFSVSCRLVSVETGEILKVTNFDYDGEIGDLLKFGMKESVYQLFDLILPEGEKRITTRTPDNSATSQYGYLKIVNYSSSKTIYLDGVAMGSIERSEPFSLLPGKHRVSFYSDEEIREVIKEYESAEGGTDQIFNQKDILWAWATAENVRQGLREANEQQQQILKNTQELFIQPGETETVYMTWRDYVKPTPTKSSSGTVSFDGGANVIFCIVLVWVGMALLFDFPIWDSSYIQ